MDKAFPKGWFLHQQQHHLENGRNTDSQALALALTHTEAEPRDLCGQVLPVILIQVRLRPALD